MKVEIGDKIDFCKKNNKWEGIGEVKNIVGKSVYICKITQIKSERYYMKNVLKNLKSEKWHLMKKPNEGETDRFTGPNGEFVPTKQPPKGRMTIQYLTELCEWLYFHENIEHEDKLKKMLNLEEMIQEFLGEIKYVPHWSEKLKKQ